ncbi:Cytochrome P450 [Popillia japonica]|uniref:Cytochrome P450 n=1 Tax=Popillia japonica TaxID=7064 RepID=A0AAW1MDK1_POPJA
MLVLPLFFVVLLWYLIICIKWKKNIFDVLEKIPGPKWYPFIGTYHLFRGVSREEIFYKFGEVVGQYAPLFRSWNGSVGEVHLMKPDHLQIVLKSSVHIIKGPLYKYLFPWLGEGVFISEGAKWFLQRKFLTSSFHFKILDSFTETFADKGLSFVKKLESKANGTYFDIVPDSAVCTLGVICELAMGVPLEQITDNPLRHIKNVYEMTELVIWRYWNPLVKDPFFYLLPQGRRYTKILKELDDFSNKVIQIKRTQRLNTSKRDSMVGAESGKKNNLSFLDIIMDAKEKYGTVTNSDLRGLMNTFLLAGYETTAITISWAIFHLGNSPEIQQKAYEELQRVVKGKRVPTTMEELHQLKFLECIIKETLRLYPVLPLITRELTEDIQIENYTVPAGTQAVLHLFGVQRDPEHFPEPNKFDPDRFLPENLKDRHPFCYVPFSAGPRNCLGMRFALLELKALLASVISHYKITSMVTPEEIKFFAHVMIRSQNGIHVKIEKRDLVA